MIARAAYSVPEARELLGGISQATFYQLVGSGELKTFLIGTRRMTSLAAIDAYIRMREAAPAPLAKSTRRESRGKS